MTDRTILASNARAYAHGRLYEFGTRPKLVYN